MDSRIPMPTGILIAVCGGLSLLLTGLVRRYALRHEMLDRPNSRSSHATPTPRGGGVAIVIAGELGLALGTLLGTIRSTDAVSAGGGVLLIAVTGWLDDRYRMG